MPADPGPESSVTGGDERRAEIEAVAREANPAFDAATHDLTRAVWLREAERYIAALDRVRDEDHETARPEQPPPDTLGGQPPAEPPEAP